MGSSTLAFERLIGEVNCYLVVFDLVELVVNDWNWDRASTEAHQQRYCLPNAHWFPGNCFVFFMGSLEFRFMFTHNDYS